ncbi:hypothetical protein EDD29_0119 [Actinocorallia herbida]|uniref:Uncharacterized protein n=1 Tax=Actinocorallia herbida TaxID=58109 RepID=A0A3N1CPI3_9ACTN|nr:hypothetical protein [Actinocorallia herbida]ROO82638.1 hypothetical protein EDD29_0119 [Actinocorallia herbida]
MSLTRTLRRLLRLTRGHAPAPDAVTDPTPVPQPEPIEQAPPPPPAPAPAPAPAIECTTKPRIRPAIAARLADPNFRRPRADEIGPPSNEEDSITPWEYGWLNLRADERNWSSR